MCLLLIPLRLLKRLYVFYAKTEITNQGYILASVAVLKSICSADEFEMVKKSSRGVRGGVTDAGVTARNDSGSSGGSSSHRVQHDDAPTLGGVISLEDDQNEEESRGELTLTIGISEK